MTSLLLPRTLLHHILCLLFFSVFCCLPVPLNNIPPLNASSQAQVVIPPLFFSTYGFWYNLWHRWLVGIWEGLGFSELKINYLLIEGSSWPSLQLYNRVVISPNSIGLYSFANMTPIVPRTGSPYIFICWPLHRASIFKTSYVCGIPYAV